VRETKWAQGGGKEVEIRREEEKERSGGTTDVRKGRGE